MKLSQAKNIVAASIDSQIQNATGRDAQRVIPYLIGGAGLGKTSVIQQIAEERDHGCYILSLAQFDAAELGGIIALIDGDAKRIMPHWLAKIIEMASTMTAVYLFLDELPQAPVSNQNVAAQVVNERRIGEFKLPDNVAIVAAGNRTSDRAGTNNMPSHLKDRLMFLEIEADLEDTIAYFMANGIHEDVTGFNRSRPEFLHKFDRDANASPSPRSWDRVSTILGWGLPPVEQAEAITGQVGRAACADFMGYVKLKDHMPDLDKVISNPDSAALPNDAMVLYATASGLAHRMNKSNAGNVIKYLKRLDQQEFAAFAVKDAVNRDQTLKQSEAVRQWILSDGKQLIL